MLDRHPEDESTPDRDLIARTAAGDRRAFERIVERHAAAVLRLATAVTDDPASAEDVLQQAFLSAYRSAASFRAESSARTWLLTIARNAAYRVRAKRGREDLMDEPLMTLGREAGWGSDDPEALAIAAERRSALTSALQSLSAGDREVLILRDVEGLSGQEAADVLGIKSRALKSRLHRARLRLAGALRAGGEIELTDGGGGWQ
ncbi:MAG: sigma-70 family RNA polymerase sigma factor [Polyangiales bacterium]